MSEKKSWDIQPKRAPARVPEPVVQAPRRAAPAPVRPTPKAKASVRAATPSVKRPPLRQAPIPKGTLKERRKKQRQYTRYILLAVLIALIAGSMYALWLPALRVQQVSASGPNSEAVQQIATMKLQGKYAFIFPRNSIFIFPEKQIRAAIMDAQPDVSAVSFGRTSFSSLSVTTTSRAGSFIWCGTTIDTPYAGGLCFDADIEGYIFKEEPADMSTTTASSTPKRIQGGVRIFSALDTELPEGQSPLRARVAAASYLPNALKFVKTVQGLGAPVSSLAIREDEADLWLQGPTRITYVLGQEKEAAELAASVLPNLDLTGGTIQYIDLRFSGKAYVKKYGQE